MDVTVIVAVISAIVALASAGIAVHGQMRLAKFQAKTQADAILARYRDPILQAAYELQSRIYNIVRNNLLNIYYVNGTNEEKRYVLENTLYVIAQYFGWTEILRREIQFLDVGEAKATRQIAKLLESIRHLFLSDDQNRGKGFRIFRGEQRAIGELMIKNEANKSMCLGYAEFVEHRDEAFRKWLEQLSKDIEDLAQASVPYSTRLVMIQRALIDLIDFLDKRYVRFPREYRDKLPPPLDLNKLEQCMLTAVQDVFKEQWPEVKDYAEPELKRLAEVVSILAKQHLTGRVTEEDVHNLLRIHKKTAQTVLSTVEGVSVTSTEIAIERAIQSIQDYANSALGVRLT